jgi:alpha-1,6-mannosyltransferase
VKLVDVNEFYAEQGGGVRTYVNQKLQAGAALGHEVVVIAPGPEDREEARLGGRILWVRSRPMPVDPRYFLLLREKAVHALLQRERPDVVEGSSAWTGGWMVARWRGEARERALGSFFFHQDPVAVYPQTFLGGRLGEERVDRLFGWYWGYLRALSARFDVTVTSGHWLAERLRGFGLHNPVAAPFGIDRADFSPRRASQQVRRQLLSRCGLGPEAALLVCVSRHHPEKRLPTLIDAVGRLSARGRQVGLVIFGDGPQRAGIERRAAAVPGVHLAGYTRDRQALADAYASADALLHGSAAETYGIAVAEALCSGLPVVVPDAGGAKDLADPAYAELYPPGDAQACAEAVERMLARDRQATGRAAAEAADARVATIDQHFEGLFARYAAESERKRAANAQKS